MVRPIDPKNFRGVIVSLEISLNEKSIAMFEEAMNRLAAILFSPFPREERDSVPRSRTARRSLGIPDVPGT